MLVVKDVHKSFGGIKALGGVSLEVKKGSIVGLIGPNGSGKTTLFNIISGFCSMDQGKIYFKGEKTDGLAPHELAMKGLCRTFQVSKAAKRMTVLENMLLASDEQIGESVLGGLFRWRDILKQEKNDLKKALSLLELVDLKNLPNEYAGNLSGGQQKLLSFARILMRDPDLVLLDEPTAGVNPTLIRKIIKFIIEVRLKHKKTFFLIEHNMKVVGNVCDKVYVLGAGEKIGEGTPEQIRRNENVLRVYLGARRVEEENKIQD